MVFLNRNFIVFPGVVDSGTSILNNLLRTIFIFNDTSIFPEPFLERIHSGMMIMLNLFDTVARNNGLSQNQFENSKSKQIKFPTVQSIEAIKKSFVFTDDWVSTQCELWETDKTVIESFVIDVNQTYVGHYSSISPLTTRPLVKSGNEYIVAQPISSLHSLIHFIWEEAKVFNCIDALLNKYYDLIWFKTIQLLTQHQWHQTGISLPPLPIDLNCKEIVLMFDTNKLVHVCLPLSNDNYAKNDETISDMWEKLERKSPLVERQMSVINHLKNEYSQGADFFSLFVYAEVGFPQRFAFPQTYKERISLWFPYTDLKNLLEYEKPDPLILWKFAKEFTEVSEECDLLYIGGTLDVFVTYRENKNSLWPNNRKRPKLLDFKPGYSGQYARQSIVRRNEHVVPFFRENRMEYRPVYLYYSYAPLYTEVGFTSPRFIFLEDFIMPIWFTYDRESPFYSTLVVQVEMLAFWLYNLKLSLIQYSHFFDSNKPLMVNVVFDQRFKENLRPREIPEVDINEIKIPIEIKNEYEISLTIPLEMWHWYSKADNEGERYMILNVLNSIISYKAGKNEYEEIKSIINRVIPVSTAKLITGLANANHLSAQNRNAPAYRTLQEYELSKIQISLITSYGITIDSTDLSSAEKKSALCSRIAKILHDKLIEKLVTFDSHELLPFLINLNEACIHEKGKQSIDIPTKIANGYSLNLETINHMLKEQDRAKMGRAVRSLIELIVAFDGNSNKGEEIPNLDDIDYLTAHMSELISWATLSDGIKWRFYNPDIQLLKCGRLEVDFLSANKSLASLVKTRTDIDVDRYVSGFKESFAGPTDDLKIPSEMMKIEDAFKTEWGIGIFTLQDFIIDLVNFTMQHPTSTVILEDEYLFNFLRNTQNAWTDDEIRSALDNLTLVSGWQIGGAPHGYKNTDTYPWYNNRGLAYNRRPIAKLMRGNKTYYFWSYRHLFAAYDNILALLFEATLWTPEGGPISKIVNELGDKKGKFFRNNVAQWLKEQTKFEIIPHEIDLNKYNSKLGDIDIAAIDRTQKIIYSIECKNSADAKTIHEFKSEMDKYFGKDEWIKKHVNRDLWLKANETIVNKLIKNSESYSIKSFIISGEEMPLTHFVKELPIPIISFPKLKLRGASLIDEMDFPI